MRVRVLRVLPQGAEPGTILDLHPDIAKSYLAVAAVEMVEDDPPSSDDASSPRRRYRRRDLVPEP